MATSKLQQAINKIKERQLPLSELRGYMTHPSPLIRANAIEVFGEHLHEDDALVDEAVAFAKDPDHSFRLMGPITVAHVAVLALLSSRSATARRAGVELVNQWQEPDRQNLISFLKSEGIETNA